MLFGVDWGGTKIEAVAMDADGVEHRRIREPTPRGDYGACISMVVDLIDRLAGEFGPIERIGIGIPGSLEPRSRLAKGASSTWLLGRPVEADLQVALACDLRVENDGDCMAASEARDGSGAGHGVVFAAILGSGVGGGVAFDGRIHHGPNNSVGEWGHSPLPLASADEVPGRPCFCGKNGCMETWASGRSFEALFEMRTGSSLKAAQIMSRVRSGDAIAGEQWESYVDRVARGLSVVVNTLDPDVIVIGGGMSNLDELYGVLPGAIGRYTFSTVFATPVVKARHGDSSGVRGAAWLWAEGS